jgi:hypothetical protein
MRLVKPDQEAKQQKITPPQLRLVLYKSELYRLPANGQVIRVLSGIAWVTAAGKDMFLVAGEKMVLTASGDIALVSALGRVPLVLEVWGDKNSNTLGTLVAPRQNWRRAA